MPLRHNQNIAHRAYENIDRPIHIDPFQIDSPALSDDVSTFSVKNKGRFAKNQQPFWPELAHGAGDRVVWLDRLESTEVNMPADVQNDNAGMGTSRQRAGQTDASAATTSESIYGKKGLAKPNENCTGDT